MSLFSFDKLSKNLLLVVIVFGLFLTTAATISGYLIGSSLMRFKINDRTITVKGLVEKSVISDYATWAIPFETNAETFDAARVKLTSSKEIIRQFLKRQGFEDHEVTFTTTAVKDRATIASEKQVQPDVRFSMEGQAVIETAKIKILQKASAEIDQIIEKGVILRTADWRSKPTFVYTKLVL